MSGSSATTTLQHYMPAIYTVLADVVMSAFLFGSLTVLSLVSTAHLLRRGIKRHSTAFMLGSVMVLYASTTVYMGVQMAYIVGYVRLLTEAVAAISSEASASSTPMALTRFGQSARTKSHIVSLVLAMNVTLGDSIVWWRVCVLWRQKFVLALGLCLITATFVLGILAAIYGEITDVMPPLLGYGVVYGGISTFISLLTNVIATSLIGRKAWKHRQVLCQCPSTSKSLWNTPTMRVLTLLFESGVVYCIILIMAMVDIIMSRTRLARTTSGAQFLSSTNLFFSGCFVAILAIYPTIIIFIVALNRSPIDGSLANASPSSISTAMLPSIVFQGLNESAVSSSSENQSIDASRAIVAEIDCGTAPRMDGDVAMNAADVTAAV